MVLGFQQLVVRSSSGESSPRSRYDEHPEEPPESNSCIQLVVALLTVEDEAAGGVAEQVTSASTISVAHSRDKEYFFVRRAAARFISRVFFPALVHAVGVMKSF